MTPAGDPHHTEANSHGNQSSGLLVMVAVVVGYAGLLYGLRAVNQTPDGLSYALAVRSGLEMFHPHHLIYVPVARGIHLATGTDPITATLWQNLFWTMVLGLAAWRLAGLVFDSPLARILAAFALLATRGVMIYSVRVETYIPALACLAVATATAAIRPRATWLLVAALTLAVLYHQTNILFVLPLILLMHPGRRNPENSSSILRTALTVVRSAALVLGVYLVGFRYDSPPVHFWDFALSYARAPIEAWGSFDYYSPSGLLTLAVSQARMVLPVKEAAAGVVGPFMVVALIALVAWHVRQLRREVPYRRLRLFGLVFLTTYLAFFLWWMPADGDFFLATLLPLWLLIVILITDLPPAVRSQPVALGLVVILAAGNLAFTIWPMHRDSGPGRAVALALDRAAPAEAAFVTGYAVQQEMLYFTDRTRVLEGDGLARAVLAGDTPWTPDGRPVVLVDGLYWRSLWDRPDVSANKFLRWLVGFDSGDNSCWTIRTLPEAEGLWLGPPRQSVGSWSALEAQIRGAFRP